MYTTIHNVYSYKQHLVEMNIITCSVNGVFVMYTLYNIRGIDVKKPPFIRNPLVCPKKFSAIGRKFFGTLDVLKSSKIMFFADFLMIIFGI